MANRPDLNLTGDSISSTFQHLLQVREDDKTLYDATGDALTDFRVTGSFTSTETITTKNVNSQFLTIEKNRTLTEDKTFDSTDNVSLMLGDNLTVGDGVSLTIENDAQFIVVPSSFFIK
tara:strand:+ start:150 stop:506 length:357 start_codon:yes stop_codon:yes gene_type:complete